MDDRKPIGRYGQDRDRWMERYIDRIKKTAPDMSAKWQLALIQAATTWSIYTGPSLESKAVRAILNIGDGKIKKEVQMDIVKLLRHGESLRVAVEHGMDGKDADEMILLAAIENDSEIMKLVENPSDDFVKKAAKANMASFLHVKNPSDSLKADVIEEKPQLISFIKNPSVEMWRSAVMKNPYLAFYHPGPNIKVPPEIEALAEKRIANLEKNKEREQNREAKREKWQKTIAKINSSLGFKRRPAKTSDRVYG